MSSTRSRKSWRSLRLKAVAQKRGKAKVKIFQKSLSFPIQVGFNEEGVYDASDYRTIYTLVGNTKQRGVGDLFKRGLMAAFMLRILELTPFFFNGGSDPRNVKLQVGTSLIQSVKISNYISNPLDI